MLVLGAGELGSSILRALAERKESSTITLTVLLRPSTIASLDLSKRAEIDTLKALGVRLLPGDLAQSTSEELAALFAPFHTVVGATGFVAVRGTQRKLAEAALRAGVRRYIPWQFGVDYDAIGRGAAQDLFDEQLDVRDMLRAQSGTEWMIIVRVIPPLD
jgi:hypothetical protein